MAPFHKWNLARCVQAFACSLLLLAASFQSSAPKGGSGSESARLESLRAFAQSFYDWYVPLVLKDNPTPPWILAVRQRRGVFSGRLASALEDDFEAQRKSPGQIVGLDFDPLLNSQDPAKHYKVGRVTHHDDHYFVEVHAMLEGKPSERVDVLAEVSGTPGHWVLLNFQYGQSGDLLTILQSLEKQRNDHQEHKKSARSAKTAALKGRFGPSLQNLAR